MGEEKPPLILSYLGLRKAIGIIGISLPFVLAIGKAIIEGPGIQPSISDYYYTVMRDVFVGMLCAIGVFLLSYRGYEKQDDIAGDLACVCAVGVAFFPTPPDGDIPLSAEIFGYLHYTFAGVFLLTLAYFSLVLFRKTDPTRAMTRRKVQRNMVYTVCGYTIIACVAAMVLYKLLPGGAGLGELDPIFWLEAVAVVAFGISWLTKGEAILGDQE